MDNIYVEWRFRGRTNTKIGNRSVAVIFIKDTAKVVERQWMNFFVISLILPTYVDVAIHLISVAITNDRVGIHASLVVNSRTLADIRTANHWLQEVVD